MNEPFRLPGRRTAGWTAGLIVAVFLVFGQVRSFGFVDYDDGDYVFRNPHVTQGPVAERVRWAFTSLYAANWHPVTWLSFIADDLTIGLDPGRMHAENLLLHAVNAALLLAVLTRITGSVGTSALVAVLFAMHPLRAESVAWVTERKGLLMALFGFMALHAYVSYARRPTAGRYLAVAALFAAALMAKPQAVALPLLLLILDWWPLGRVGAPRGAARGGVVREKLPLLALSAAATALTVLAQREAGAVASLAVQPVGTRFANAVVSTARYLGQTFWPVGLSPVYPLAAQPPWRVFGAVILLAVVTSAAVRQRQARPWLAAGWFGFLILLAPVANLFQTGGQSMADRYTYLPHLPLLMALVWSVRGAVAASSKLRQASIIVAVGSAALLGAIAHLQAALWHDEVALFTRAVTVTDGNWKMNYDLANALDRRGGSAAEVERHYLLALAARPDYPEALNNLGVFYARRGEQTRSQELFRRAVLFNPGYGMGWFNLGFNLEQAGDGDGALESYGRARALLPANVAVHLRLGALLVHLGWLDDGLAECREAQRLDPSLEIAPACLGAPGC